MPSMVRVDVDGEPGEKSGIAAGTSPDMNSTWQTGVTVGVAVRVGVRVAVGHVLPKSTCTSSMYHPSCEPEESVPSRKRSLTVDPP